MNKESNNMEFVDTIEDEAYQQRLWDIYDSSFRHTEEVSPCKQTFSRSDFIRSLRSPTIKKLILITDPPPHAKYGFPVGLIMFTNHLDTCPWVSTRFFETNYYELYKSMKIFYIQAFCVHIGYRNAKNAISLLRSATEFIHNEGAMAAFDHSLNANNKLSSLVKRATLNFQPVIQEVDLQKYFIVKQRAE